jgi:signal peptidase I
VATRWASRTACSWWTAGARASPNADPEAIDSVYFGPVRVRPGTVFVLGDNRANSEDSRAFGAVPTGRLIGRVRARIWPPARWGAPH